MAKVFYRNFFELKKVWEIRWTRKLSVSMKKFQDGEPIESKQFMQFKQNSFVLHSFIDMFMHCL